MISWSSCSIWSCTDAEVSRPGIMISSGFAVGSHGSATGSIGGNLNFSSCWSSLGLFIVVKSYKWIFSVEFLEMFRFGIGIT